MSRRDGYEPGVPCRVASVHADPARALEFYRELFGWEATSLMPAGRTAILPLHAGRQGRGRDRVPARRAATTVRHLGHARAGWRAPTRRPPGCAMPVAA